MTARLRLLATSACAGLCLCGCNALIGVPEELPRDPPALSGMEEPLALQSEPQDEEARAALPAGSFSGIYVVDARASLDALLGEPEGLRIERVVENSPGDAAGLEPGDLLLEVRGPGDSVSSLRWPSEWRALELAQPAGSELELVYDRAGAQRSAKLVLVARLHPSERLESLRLREESRVGVVLRSPTEVEARAAGIAPGAGAVVVGLAAESPWRKAGVHFEDLILAVDGAPVAHPQLVLDHVRGAESDAKLRLSIARGAERLEISAPLTQRERETSQVYIPLLFSYENVRGSRETSVLLGLVRYRHTKAAWDWRLLWLFTFGGGDADKLEKVDY
jgi:C-terminal processing protease CtpA/Prc